MITRIYRDYAGGTSPKAIAHALNREGVPGPRGGAWSPSAIYGDRRAGDGILCQELYVGVRVFNRRRFRKHPDTGRRSSVLNDGKGWIREPVPALRLLDDDLWAAVQSRQKLVAAQPAAPARKPKRLLSGLLRCSLCGAGMTLNGAKYTCSVHRERGTCPNGKIIAAETVERRVLLASRAPLERELAEIARKLERAQDMCLNEVISIADLKGLTAKHAARREALEIKLSSLDAPADVAVHPTAAQAYAKLVDRLYEAMDDVSGEKVRTELRALIERADFEP